jgi:hypothetical protein
MLYMHSKYMTFHRMQSSQLSLYICFRPMPKHMHTNTSSMKSFSKTCNTSSCYVFSYSVFMGFSTCKATTPGLVNRSGYRIGPLLIFFFIAFQILHVFLLDNSVHCALIEYAYI